MPVEWGPILPRGDAGSALEGGGGHSESHRVPTVHQLLRRMEAMTGYEYGDDPNVVLNEIAEGRLRLDPADPYFVGKKFFDTLMDSRLDRESLRAMTTPESRRWWGDDFNNAAVFAKSIVDPGFSSRVTYADDDPEVAYFPVFVGVRDRVRMEVGDSLDVKHAIVTLVWRDDFSRWLVHRIGEPVPADAVPHSPRI